MKKKIIVLGAGYAGVLSAKKLEKKLKKHNKNNEFEITIIDKKPFHTMLTELHEVAAWRVEEDSIKISLSKVFAGRNVNVVLDTIKDIDYKTKLLNGENGSYKYDYLVLATGSQPVFFGVEGASENTFKLWSYEDAVKLREHIMEMFRQAVLETNLEKKKQLLTFFVVGAGFTGVEMAGELAELIPHLCKRFEVSGDLVRMVNVDILDRACTILPPNLSAKVERRLIKMGVDVMLKTDIVNVSTNSIEYKNNGVLKTEKTSTVIWAAGVESSEISKASKEIGGANRGRIQTNEYLQSINDPSVYISGDNLFYIPENEEMPVPQMVENCEHSAGCIANNLFHELTGKGELEKYKPKFHGVMVSIGGRYGVAHVGLPGKFFSLPSFLAMLSKHFINIIYFIQVLGWNKAFSYSKHEFFTIRDCRSFVGGHFSNRSPSFFLVPLRIFLGGYWLYEGIKKVGEGWLREPKLEEFFNGANQFYNALLGYGVDATSSASVEPVGKVIFNFNIFNLVKIIFVNAGEYAFKIQVGLVDLFVNNLIIPSIPMQGFFQYLIVISEILIGLALIAGLLTTISSAYSLLLQMLFLTSTGLYMSSWWMIFAAIAMLFGGGRVLSLDYYVMPVLKKYWSKLGFVKKWYLYND